MTSKPDPIEQIASERRASLSRRHFLRGVGACVALPTLTSLRPATLLAADAPAAAALGATAAGVPLRSAFIFFPNGAIPSAWWPEEEGAEFEFSRTLEPLGTSRKFVQVLGGLDHLAA